MGRRVARKQRVADGHVNERVDEGRGREVVAVDYDTDR